LGLRPPAGLGDEFDDRVTDNVSWEDDREACLERMIEGAKALLNWPLVEKVAAALLEGQKLSRAELLQVCGF
jgi:hypothetical protein